MIKLNRTVEYGLMALRYLGEKSAFELSSAGEVSEALSISFDTTARVMQLLSQKNILKVEHGAGGGYRLNRNLEQISLGEFISAIEGTRGLVKCLNPDSICEISSTCNISSPVQVINSKLNKFYENLTLQEIFSDSAVNSVDSFSSKDSIESSNFSVRQKRPETKEVNDGP